MLKRLYLFTIIERPVESLIGIAILSAGVVIYYFDIPQQCLSLTVF
jgi:hypothetical protein